MPQSCSRGFSLLRLGVPAPLRSFLLSNSTPIIPIQRSVVGGFGDVSGGIRTYAVGPFVNWRLCEQLFL